jgi:membrane fusion protein (multidrug efflux system)
MTVVVPSRIHGVIRRLALLTAAAGLALTAGCQRGSPGHAAAPSHPPAMTVVQVQPESVTLTTDWLATLDGYVNAEVRPQVTGYLVKRLYREGARVKKGDVLFEIDPRPFDAVLAQAKAKLAESQAQLSKADRDVARDTPLAEQHAIAQSQLDDDREARAAAAATVQSAQAAVDAAALNVSFTKVTSLIDGVAAIASAQIGDLVGPTTVLTTVSQVNPIKAYFPLSEREYLPLASRLNRGTPGRLWNNDDGLTLILVDGSVYPRRGRFLAADRSIDASTSTIRVSAEFPNPDDTLRPGQFARVRAATRVITGALLVPQRAVTELQGLYRVRVVGSDHKVQRRTVTVGDRVGSRWIVPSGLSAGETVVVEGPDVPDGTAVTTAPYAPSVAER